MSNVLECVWNLFSDFYRQLLTIFYSLLVQSPLSPIDWLQVTMMVFTISVSYTHLTLPTIGG